MSLHFRSARQCFHPHENFNAFAKDDVTWIWNYLVTLAEVTSVAYIQQIIVFKFTLRMAALRQKVINVPIS